MLQKHTYLYVLFYSITKSMNIGNLACTCMENNLGELRMRGKKI